MACIMETQAVKHSSTPLCLQNLCFSPDWAHMCLEVKVCSPLFHALPVEVTVELCSFFSSLLNVLWNLAGLDLLMVLLLHLL